MDFKFDRSGYRVPAIIVSPWVDEGIVINEEHRHTSMIATLRKVWAALLDGHRKRRRNKGRAAWQVVAGRLVIAYDHPDGDDPLVARIVTIWRRR
jgi:hypothetical protein